MHRVSRDASPLKLVQILRIICVHYNHKYLYPFLFTRHASVIHNFGHRDDVMMML
jgi:hypothetical protein